MLISKGKSGASSLYRGLDISTNKQILIKRNIEILNNKYESEKILKEILLFENFYSHPNIIKLLNVIKSKNEIDIYYIFEYIEANLSNVICSKILTEIHIKYITFQLVKALKYIHSADIIHRDLTTNNIMIDKNSNIKIVDFSLAISLNDKSSNNFAINDYIQTRWYRAPELLLNAVTYDQSVDMWSVGCILAEMIIGRILFKGNSTINQLSLIMELTGFPTADDIASINSKLASGIIHNTKVHKSKTYEEVFEQQKPEVIDFLKKILVLNPKKRMTVDQALDHEYLSEFKNELEVIELAQKISFDYTHEFQLEVALFKEKIMQEMLNKK